MQLTRPTTQKVDTRWQCRLLSALRVSNDFTSRIYATEDKILGDRKNPDNIKRRVRVFGNDIENIPFHTTIFWGAFVVQCFANMSDYGESETVALTILIVLYSGLRLAFTLCYAFAIQPVRSICFVLANLCVLAAACVMVSSAFNVKTGHFLS